MAVKDIHVHSVMSRVRNNGRLDLRTPQIAQRTSESGQAVILFAVLLPVTVLFMLGILDYLVTNARVMETVAAADLAAHAGAQEINVLPDGTIETTGQGNTIAALYFQGQNLAHAQLTSVSCEPIQGRPACRVQAQTRSVAYLLPERWITVEAVGYLAYGVTRDDQ